MAGMDPYDGESVNAIAAMLSDKENWVRLNAAGALQSMGAVARPAIEKLRAAGATEDADLKNRVNEAVTSIEQAEADETVIEAWNQRRESIRAYLDRRPK